MREAMKREEFMNKFVEMVGDKLGEDYKVFWTVQDKNNGTDRASIQIEASYMRINPGIALLPYFKQYKRGFPMDMLVDHIIRRYKEERTEKILQVSWLNDWEQMKDRLIYQLVNREKNEESLEGTVTFPFLDLSIVLQVIVQEKFPRPHEEIETISVTETMLKRWGKSREEIIKKAVENRRKYTPWYLLELYIPCDFESNDAIDFSGQYSKRKAGYAAS